MVDVTRPSKVRTTKPNTPAGIWSTIRTGTMSECWEWAGSRVSTNYGQVKYNGRPWRAHRLIWTFVFGEIPAGMHICHHCDNPPCCNPFHLFLGTPGDNVRDAMRKGRLVKGETHPFYKNPPPHIIGDNNPSRRMPERLARGERQGSAVLKELDIPIIRERRSNGEFFTTIAADYGVTPKTIENVVTKHTWAHIPD